MGMPVNSSKASVTGDARVGAESLNCVSPLATVDET